MEDIEITAKGYGKALYGRRVIYTDETEITAENIAGVIRNAYNVHTQNRDDIDYLYNYYKGKQPILDRIKQVRPEINNKIVVNYANEIVSFKVGYLISEPVQYVARDKKNDAVQLLNNYMYQVGKQAQDKKILEWNHICGTAYRYVQALEPDDVKPGNTPFDLFTLDPRTTFIIYSSTFKETRMAAVTYTISEDNDTVKNFVVYTKNKVFTFSDNGIETDSFKEENNALGEIPIYEYPANNARLGAFEIVLPLLDAINRTESNRLDGIEQQIQTFLKFINCDIDNEGIENLQKWGAIKIKSDDGRQADVQAVTVDFSQDGAQLSKDDLYSAVLTICGMPAQGKGQSVSANNGAILIQNGWSQAETRAQASETMFKDSERLMLKLIFEICATNGKEELDLNVSDVDAKFKRHNYENVQVKAQVLCEMLNSPRVHPKLAFESCGLFSDPENAYLISEEHYQEMLKEWKVEDIPDKDGVNGDGRTQTQTIRTDGLADSDANDGAS